MRNRHIRIQDAYRVDEDQEESKRNGDYGGVSVTITKKLSSDIKPKMQTFFKEEKQSLPKIDNLNLDMINEQPAGSGVELSDRKD